LIGRILDVALDLRRGSPTFGRHVTVELSAESGCQVYIPRGFAHGYITRAPYTIVGYKVDDEYAPDLEGGIAWNDPELKINWGKERDAIIISDKDQHLPWLREIESPFTFQDQIS
jgi:dTDP-4-dehydrorhamnose 3,5-epimerase